MDELTSCQEYNKGIRAVFETGGDRRIKRLSPLVPVELLSALFVKLFQNT